jgi:hypothetical protein
VQLVVPTGPTLMTGQVMSCSRWPVVGATGVHEATGTLLALMSVQVVVTQLLPAPPTEGSNPPPVRRS